MKWFFYIYIFFHVGTVETIIEPSLTACKAQKRIIDSLRIHDLSYHIDSCRKDSVLR